ncbi:MAG TPA: tRNA (adenosine(37)-N6)-dimethylallyltransferase MiaA [Leptospiraceae bacterium]|nr:tRNA (adenosine(37)-N6)-dimethylallyltransferase MiaA [Leptospiraceae bacterium]
MFGPTGSGKTAALCRLTDVYGDKFEVIACDSRQLYRGLEITSAAPTSDELAIIPHHLISILHPNEETTAFRFRRLAAEAVTDILSRGHVPVLSVGTGFYFKAMRTRTQVSTPDASVREAIQSMTPSQRLSELSLKRPDLLQKGGGRIHENDDYRIGRALENLVPGREDLLPEFPCEFLSFYLDISVSDLNERLRLRVLKMIELGLVEELRGVFDRFGKCPGLSLIGFDLVQLLLTGELSADDFAERLWIEHRQYAKRQRTWFRREKIEARGSWADFVSWVGLFVDPRR